MAKLRALRRMRYGTRMLQAGDPFEVTRRQDARLLVAIKHAELVPETAPEPQRRTRRPRRQEIAAPEPEPAVEAAPEPAAEDEMAAEAAPDALAELEDHTREELLEMVAARGIELPGGYTRKDELVQLLRDSGDEP